jgi:hypothetical protein
MQRPTGITILGVLCYIGAALCLLGGILGFAGGAMIASLVHTAGAGLPAGIAGAIGGIIGGVFILLAVLYGLTGYGLMALKNWGRIILIVLMILGLLGALFALLGVFQGFAMSALIMVLIRLAINVWILWYLFTPNVKAAFGQTA